MHPIVYASLFVALGGALGALARFALNLSLNVNTEFPWGTLAANFLGCMIMGVLAQCIVNAHWFHQSGIFPEQYRLLFVVGFCGSFTTLSALVFEVSAMLQRDEILASFSYLMVTIVGGFVCFYIGVVATRGLLSLLFQGST
ncbi:MAG TPA: fluoride efflux transporter CrcB [Woeseiaceae bacterium]|nr:fluoride efflux transporter CrcB [Woeseiaceae bacterium]